MFGVCVLMFVLCVWLFVRFVRCVACACVFVSAVWSALCVVGCLFASVFLFDYVCCGLCVRVGACVVGWRCVCLCVGLSVGVLFVSLCV